MTIRRDRSARQINTEHQAYWSGQQSTALPGSFRRLKSFFVAYARRHLRNFPWRRFGTKPFHLLIAELLLVQTKAEDVARVWPGLIRRYPNPSNLARVRQSTLIHLLKPLGFQRRRARALKDVSRALVDFHLGEVPQTMDGLLSLPHVGLYIATAMACFGFGKRVPIVDSNVIRVFDRITGTQGARDVRRRFDTWALAWGVLPRVHAKSHNYGLLDFAAQTCTSREPFCAECKLAAFCAFGQKKLRAERAGGAE